MDDVEWSGTQSLDSCSHEVRTVLVCDLATPEYLLRSIELDELGRLVRPWSEQYEYQRKQKTGTPFQYF